MKQKVFHYKFNVDVNGEPLAFNLNDEIEKLSGEGWNIKQISSCMADLNFPEQASKSILHVLLFAEKSV